MIFNVSKSYEDMLNKIGIFTLGFLVCGWYLILLSFPEFKKLINNSIKNFFEISGSIKLFSFTLPIVFVIPIFIALIFRIIKLHDKISNLFKIRLKYDLQYIILPLAEGSNISINSINNIKENRSKIMNKIFYNYVGYENPQIDKHLINMALDSLCWYWIVVEGLVVTSTTLSICIFSSRLGVIRFLILVLIFLIVSYILLEKSCIKKTESEIKAILDDEERKKYIEEFFVNSKLGQKIKRDKKRNTLCIIRLKSK
ncbi:hypothetical protein ACFO6R_13260 [Eubacterium multiforme]|uniref:ABC transmembrane type-1 domain-containing protein n=1 Tax=Eubacterium multiforme TaxID=83339 RepID=A0ABT9UXH4_9FIRM|nr:hypothetical protein [Eubacterium multiforme]MDQ0151019.1 hypothetical protein [Eubacterium multiforme]